jgi:beta-lactam-binding protein with PASTA domain
MRQFLRYLALALVLLTVALVSALTTMRLAIHGREVPVPKLVGLTPGEAERQAVAHGLLFSVESRYFSGDVPAGRIISQAPQPGAKVRRGSRVRVAESLGAQRIITPNVLGQSTRAAEINVRRRGLELGSVAVAHIPGLPEDQVVAQSPAPNTTAITPKLSVLVNAPAEAAAYVMPELVGQPLGEAVKSIQGAGMKVGGVTFMPALVYPQGASAPLPGTITKQTPAPGQKVMAGTVVALEVAK